MCIFRIIEDWKKKSKYHFSKKKKKMLKKRRIKEGKEGSTWKYLDASRDGFCGFFFSLLLLCYAGAHFFKTFLASFMFPTYLYLFTIDTFKHTYIYALSFPLHTAVFAPLWISKKLHTKNKEEENSQKKYFQSIVANCLCWC